MNIHEVFISQYKAALEMLRQTIFECPQSIWNSTDDRTKFWHIAYHVLFHTHLYLQESVQSFIPWDKHREEYEFIGPLPWPPHAAPKIGEPFDKETLLEFVDFCQQEIEKRIPELDLEVESGFSWLQFSKLEHLIYNLRHLQQHTGELMERLGTRTDVEISWVGSCKPPASRTN